MLRIYCPFCNGQLELADHQKSATCKNCNNEVQIPQGYRVAESSFLYAKEAHIRRDYASAVAAYDEIIKKYPENGDAYWGRALSRYEIEYQDIGNQEFRLVCHQATRHDFSADSDVKKAVLLSSGKQQEYYKGEIKKIGALSKAVAEHAALTEAYDVLIDAASSSEKSKALAQKIQLMLKAAGLRTFCPALELENMPRQQWEPALYRAFSTVSAMVIVAADAEAFSRDVCFDAERFLSRKVKMERKADRQVPKLYLAFQDLDEYEDIPDELFDGFDMRIWVHANDFAMTLCSAVEKNVSNFKKTLNPAVSRPENFNYSNKIDYADQEREAGHFNKAKKIYDQILSYNAKESQAYWGLFLIENNCQSAKELIEKGIECNKSANFKNALAFASERESQVYEQVAADAFEQKQILNRKDQKKKQKEAEIEEERKQKEIEIENNYKKVKKDEEKRKKRVNGRGRLFFIGAAVLVILGVSLYSAYMKKNSAYTEKYKEARNLYQNKEFQEAQTLYEELAKADFKDSAEMVQMCIQQWNLSEYKEAAKYGENLSQRVAAVRVMQSAVATVPDAQEYLDNWKEEGLKYYQEGNLKKAYLALAGFGTTFQEAKEMYSLTANWGIIAAADNGAMAGISESTGHIISAGCTGLKFKDGTASSVSLSQTGDSAAVATTEGTVYLTGIVAGRASISGWSDIIVVKTGDNVVWGLTEDGVLRSSNAGVVAEDIVQFSAYEGTVAAVKSDGTVFTNSPAFADAVKNWTDIMSIATNGTTVIGIDKNGELLQNDNRTFKSSEPYLAVMAGGEKFGVIAESGKFYISGGGYDGEENANSVMAAGLSLALNLRVSENGDVSALIYGNSDADITMRKNVNNMDDCGMYMEE